MLDMVHFNPLPPHGGRLEDSAEIMAEHDISIHSLRMEGDWQMSTWKYSIWHFNPLPPHGGRRETCPTCRPLWCNFNPLPPHGGRRKRRWRELLVVIFQSTPSAWRETATDGISSQNPQNFNPLPPHGGRRLLVAGVVAVGVFQSTPSAWRETAQIVSFPRCHNISIHSLRMEGDV